MNVSKTRQYPPQTGPYAVKVKNGAGWRGHDTARLHISVGGLGHEGEKFAATAEWVRHRFSRTIVCVNDTLQRFNVMFEEGKDEDTARRICAEEGAAWIRRNLDALNRLPGLEVHRWDGWRADPGYSAVDGLTARLRAAVPALDAAIAADIEEMWTRRQRQQPHTYRDRRKAGFTALGNRYIEEELDRFAVIARRARAVDIYPGSFLRVWGADDPLPGAEAITGGTFTRIDFRRQAAASPIGVDSGQAPRRPFFPESRFG